MKKTIEGVKELLTMGFACFVVIFVLINLIILAVKLTGAVWQW